MYKCEYEKLQSWWKPQADELVKQFSETLDRMIEEDPEGPVATLCKQCATSKTMDREFLKRLATGDHLKTDHPLCEDLLCEVCH